MMGDRFCSGDLRMAGRARAGNLRGSRVVRVVTADAGFQRIVDSFDDLGEAGRSRCQKFVAVQAGGATLPRDDWKRALQAVGVGVGGPVADLAGESTMVRGILDLALGVVALETLTRAGVPDLKAFDAGDGIRSIMTELAKRLGNKPGPEDNRSAYGHNK